MKKRSVKKILLISLSTFVLLAAVLAVHIYMVTRPKAPTANTKVMARLDFKQAINKEDAAKITGWLYAQNGVDRVMCNEKSRIAVFTFYPVKTNADVLTSELKNELHYSVVRYMPSQEELQSGCPVGAGSFTSKVSSSVSHLFN